ncbi:hypothetical protein [Methylobacterium sp. 1973]|uniref:hypothetical protein n=1 Tax=Methylobacterium sp. 1973 TaxID=3156421 RepID=UPI00339AF21A
MSRYAHIVDGIVAEIITLPDGVTPGKDVLTEEVAAALVAAQSDTVVGMTFDGKAFGPVPAMPLPPVPVVISDRQFGEGLWHDGLITFDEYIAFVGPGTIPPALLKILDTLADDDTGQPTPRKIAIGLVTGAKEYQRTNPLVDIVRDAQGWTTEQLDEHWRAWAAL